MRVSLWTFWALKTTPPGCLRSLGTSHLATHHHIPDKMQLHQTLVFGQSSTTYCFMTTGKLTCTWYRTSNQQNKIQLILHAVQAALFCKTHINLKLGGFGGLVVSMLASGTRVHGLRHGQSRWIFRVSEQILSMPSFGGEVKESVPRPSFAACKRT